MHNNTNYDLNTAVITLTTQHLKRNWQSGLSRVWITYRWSWWRWSRKRRRPWTSTVHRPCAERTWWCSSWCWGSLRRWCCRAVWIVSRAFPVPSSLLSRFPTPTHRRPRLQREDTWTYRLSTTVFARFAFSYPTAQRRTSPATRAVDSDRMWRHESDPPDLRSLKRPGWCVTQAGRMQLLAGEPNVKVTWIWLHANWTGCDVTRCPGCDSKEVTRLYHVFFAVSWLCEVLTGSQWSLARDRSVTSGWRASLGRNQLCDNIVTSGARSRVVSCGSFMI